MLSRYEGKIIKITTDDGSVFTGEATVNPSGYGLVEFDREEESVLLQDTMIFLSEIVSIEDLSAPAREATWEQLQPIVSELLEQPYRIADILPRQVPKDAEGQYFAVDRYYRQPAQMARVHQAHAELLLRLNCYVTMAVSFDNCESWQYDPDPQAFVRQLCALRGNTFLRAVFPSERAMIDIMPDETWMTVYCHEPSMTALIRQLTAAAGFFLWEPQKEEGEERQ